MAQLDRYLDALKNGYDAIKEIIIVSERDDITNSQKIRTTEFISKYSIIKLHAILKHDSSQSQGVEIERNLRLLVKQYPDVISLLDKGNQPTTYLNYGNNNTARI